MKLLTKNDIKDYIGTTYDNEDHKIPWSLNIPHHTNTGYVDGKVLLCFNPFDIESINPLSDSEDTSLTILKVNNPYCFGGSQFKRIPLFDKDNCVIIDLPYWKTELLVIELRNRYKNDLGRILKINLFNKDVESCSQISSRFDLLDL